MALPMVHLIVADEWAGSHPEYSESPEFFYGAISPDAIHIRFGNDKSRKDEFHLHNWISPHPDPVIDYWRRCHSPFDIGYGVHVLTDGQWVERYKTCLPGLMDSDGRLDRDTYYNDTFVTDFRLYNESPRLRAIMRMIGTAATPREHPWLTEYEFTRWRENMLDAYSKPCPKGDPVRYIDEAYVRAFVKDSLSLIEETYARFQREKYSQNVLL